MPLSKPLDGLKVVDLTIWIYGPVAGTLLADLGADVVKIERPKLGDMSRSLPVLQGAPLFMAREDGGRDNVLFELCNRNKRSIELDLRHPEGQAIFGRLIGEADAFVTNFQPSTLEAFGALPSRLFEYNPQLIYGLGGGLGHRGAFFDVPSQDTTAMAYSGFMHTASPDPEVPYYPPGGLADVSSGTNLAFGVVSALLARQRDGRGRLVTTSLLQSLAWTQMLSVGVAANTGGSLRSAPRTAPTHPLMNSYRTADGRYLALGIPHLSDDVFGALLRALDAPALAADPIFANEEQRFEHKQALVAALDRQFLARPLPEWIERCRAEGLWCAPVNRPEALADDPAVIEENLIGETRRGLRYVRAPFSIAETQESSAPAPSLGADGRAVLAELGLADSEIDALITRGVLGGV